MTADSFEIPLLSVQPLVENAVKHGVGMKEDGGTVTISTRENDENYEIIVSDDGWALIPARSKTTGAPTSEWKTPSADSKTSAMPRS